MQLNTIGKIIVAFGFGALGAAAYGYVRPAMDKHAGPATGAAADQTTSPTAISFDDGRPLLAVPPRGTGPLQASAGGRRAAEGSRQPPDVPILTAAKNNLVAELPTPTAPPLVLAPRVVAHRTLPPAASSAPATPALPSSDAALVPKVVEAKATPTPTTPVLTAPNPIASLPAAVPPSPGAPPASKAAGPLGAPPKPAPVECDPPELVGAPLSSGRMGLSVTAPCDPGRDVRISYSGLTLVRRLDDRGRLSLVLDIFTHAKGEVEVDFGIGRRLKTPIVADDLDKVAKIALVWQAPVNLDLHAYEYFAPHGQGGHIWEKSPSSELAARELATAGARGRGFLSRTDGGSDLGDKLEVYTFWPSEGQSAGSVSVAVDYETRGASPTGASCGDGQLAGPTFRLLYRRRTGEVSSESGAFAPAACDQPFIEAARFNRSAFPKLEVKQ